jgi:phospho-N-acetylmuramoyl-pentapeptide-transferase
MIHLLGGMLEGGFRAWSFLRLLDYLSVRAIGAAMFAFILMLVVMPRFIWYLHRRGLVDQVRDTGVPSAFDKAGTPVMGGAVMVGSVLASCLVWGDPLNPFLLATLVGTLWFAAIGLSDDLAKWRARSGNRGMSEARKLLLQGTFALLLVGFLASPWSPLPAREGTTVYLPFIKRAVADSPWVYFPMVWLFVMLVGNAVNITDGLDGLAIVPSVFAVSVLGVFAYIMGNAIWARYFLFHLLPGSGELIVFCAAFAGAGLGFLWYNAYPAQVFMGDAGSLAIGGCLATLSVLTKQEALFLILGGLFIAEALTSQIQDKVGIKLLGRRLFYRAPLHHQLQHTGVAETKVVIRLWIVSFILAMASIATLKLR